MLIISRMTILDIPIVGLAFITTVITGIYREDAVLFFVYDVSMLITFTFPYLRPV